MAKKKVPDLHNKFFQTINQSTRFRAEGGKDDPKYYWRNDRAQNSERELYNMNLQEATQQSQRSPERTARDLAYYKTRSQRFVSPNQPGPSVAELDREAARPRVRQVDVDIINRKERDRNWRSQANVYRQRVQDRRSPGGFVREEAAPSHKEWIENAMQDKNSEFNKGLPPGKKTGRYTSGQRRRLQTYTDALQRGETHSEALERVRKSRIKENVGRSAQRVQAGRDAEVRQAVAPSRPSGRPSKFTSVAPQANEFSYGISAQAVPKVDELKRRFPTKSDQELLQLQTAGAEFISSELLANERWAHETRRANLLGKKAGRGAASPDRVTIFTTNVGHPSVSIPSDSLVGQYIVKKRKSVLGGAGVPGSQLKGKFPEAVRDAHIVDVATGASLGIQGRQGIFNSSGYRFGKKSSPGYGKPRPLGAHILYDSSSGRPLYDSQGNIRYSEGATRPIDYTTPNVGFRILIG